MTTTVRKAVFPVAGMGTRFLPATKANPKEMLPVTKNWETIRSLNLQLKTLWQMYYALPPNSGAQAGELP